MKRWIIRGCIFGTLSLMGVSGAVLAQRYLAPDLFSRANSTAAASNDAEPQTSEENAPPHDPAPPQPFNNPAVVRGNEPSPDSEIPRRPSSSFGFASPNASRYGDAEVLPEVSPAAYQPEAAGEAPERPSPQFQPPTRLQADDDRELDHPPARLLPEGISADRTPNSPRYAEPLTRDPLPASGGYEPREPAPREENQADSRFDTREERESPPQFPRPSGIRYPTEPEPRHLGSPAQPRLPAEGTPAPPPRLSALGAPGAPQLEGPQAPALLIQKTAPPEIQVGKPATFTAVVRNMGPVPAHDVVLVDQVPEGTELIDTTPAAQSGPQGGLIWPLGTLEPGAEKTVIMQVMPQQEGELGSVAVVQFQSQASIRTLCTKPQLSVEQTAPRQVLIGQEVKLSIKIHNSGTGAASGVVLEENVPDGLSHPSGHELEYEVGVLQPGESRNLELTLVAAAKGQVRNVLVLREDGNREVVSQPAMIEVIAPELELAINGPRKRYLQREAVYQLAVLNPGTAVAQNVQLAAHLPKGLRFISAGDNGRYDAASHAIYWNVTQIPPGRQGQLEFTTLPAETGEQRIRVEGGADLGLAANTEQTVLVEGLAELSFQVSDLADPIEIGNETSYLVTVTNSGSKPATEVVVLAQLPPGMRPVSGDGARSARVEGQEVIFAPLPRLAPKEEAAFRITVRGEQPGDHRVRVQVLSAETQAPVTKEESTRVYADQ